MAKIEDKHLFHGAALSQIALHTSFTAINSIVIDGKKLRSAYRINANIGLYLKYAQKPTSPHDQYQFTFTTKHLEEIEQVAKGMHKTFLALVCERDREIACLSREQLSGMIAARRSAAGRTEKTYVVLVVAPNGKKLRAYMDVPRRRNLKLGELLISRNSFPNRLFT